jgi:uncharacterized protein (DUF427 family)
MAQARWKGRARYDSLIVNGAENTDAAWSYPEAGAEAKNIEGFIAFWRGVEFVDDTR